MKLKKGLGLFHIFAIAAGAMISSGLFILPGLAFMRAGPGMILSYIIAGFLVIPSILSISELATAMPKSGGDYFYITRSMGFGIGTIAGFASWFAITLKSAFALLGIGIFTLLINPDITMWEIKLIAALFCIIFMFINILGVKEAGITQILLVILLVVILVIYACAGILNIESERYTPFAPYGFLPVLSTAGLVFISFGGLTKVASVAEEVYNPKVNIPLGMFMAFFVVLILYGTTIFVTTGILEPDILKNSLTPISDGARVFWGTKGVVLTAIAALLAFISTANAGIMSASRYPLAMSRDQLLPRFFKKVNRKFKTPHRAIIITTFFMVIIILFLNLQILIEAASTMLLLLFISANLAVIVMRESKIQNYQPSFRPPLYPYVQIIAVIGYGFLIVDMGLETLIITGLFICLSLCWYLIYVKPTITRSSALMYLVERVTDRAIVTDTLKDELREIIKEREEIIEDKFDHLIKDALILDLPEKTNFDDFIKTAAEKLKEKIDVNIKTLMSLFIEREKQSCTALRSGLAIPHIVIKGSKKFEVMLVRAKKGIIFPDAKDPVHIVFILIGSKDMRHLHLQALMAIAQITQHHDFDKKWINASGPDDLRDIVLLGKRKRQ